MKEKINELDSINAGPVLGGFGNKAFSIKLTNLRNLNSQTNNLDNSDLSEEPVIGDIVTGQSSDGVKYTGEIVQIDTDGNDKIEFVYVLDDRTQKRAKLIASTLNGLEKSNQNQNMYEHVNIISLEDFKKKI